MELFIKNDPKFTINKPYFYCKNLDINKEYDIYTNGLYINIGKESFCCVGGTILDHKNSEKIGEFFAPINTEDSYGKNITPNYEKISIDTALLIKEKYNLKVLNIFNSNLQEVSKYWKNKNIQWVSRKDNIANNITTYCKNHFKKDVIKSLKSRSNLFENSYDNNIFIVSYSKPERCLYYYFALNEEKEIIEHIKFNKPNDFGAIELITKMLNNNFENINYHISKNIFNIIKNYVKGDILSSSEIKCYNNFFNIIEQNNCKLSLKLSNNIIYPKKKVILNHLGFNKF